MSIVGSRSHSNTLVLALAFCLAPQAVYAQGINGFGPFAGFGNGFGNGGFGNGFANGAAFNLMSDGPVLGMFNGQTATMRVQDFQWFPVNVQVAQAGGQVAFVPQWQPVPVGNNFPVQAAIIPFGGFVPGVTPNVDNVLDQLRQPGSGNRVRANLAPTFNRAGLAPPFPITTFITPQFAGGASGAAVPFTQVIYPPSMSTFGAQTSMTLPASGFGSLGGWGGGTFGRNNFGPVGGGPRPFSGFR